MNARESFAYVVRVEGSVTILNLHDTNRGQVATHPDGLASVTEVGSMIGIGSGSRLFVARVRSLSFAEPREAHTSGIASTAPGRDPLRHLEAVVVGYIERFGDEVRFVGGGVFSPALGAEAYPLSTTEVSAVLGTSTVREPSIELGRDARGGGSVRCGLDQLLPRHVAVLGSTGQGKSCFTAAFLQQIVKMPGARIVIFDVNGEYERALYPGHVESTGFKRTALGADGMKIPYFALGRAGLFRLLLPSEKTQRPALTFALDNLKYVEANSANSGAGLVDDRRCIFFDDCRPDGANEAWSGIQKLREGRAREATRWPHMASLAALVAESHSVMRARSGFERNAFAYGAVSPLVGRIHRYIDDRRFRAVVDVESRPPSRDGSLDWEAEGRHLCHEIFGSEGPVDWRVHIVDLRAVSHDLMPFVLGSLLELLAQDLFGRGPESTYPTLLVLEEAHHYLRPTGDTGDEGAGRSSLAYERLAKEGRKFQLNLWLSTQRPSEVSPTVLGQCGTWVVFRLTSEQDRNAVFYAGEWADRRELERIAALPRQQAMIFGAGVPVPIRLEARTADPRPRSDDADYNRWLNNQPATEASMPKADP